MSTKARTGLTLCSLLLAVCLSAGCRPSIGDGCQLSTDCDTQGTRLCDTSQPGGYCTIFNCDPDKCPSESACVEVHGETDRFARRFCLFGCDHDSDCRSGYVCIDPTKRDGAILDSKPQHQKVCMP